MAIHVTYHPFSSADVGGLYLGPIGRDAAIEGLALALGLNADGSTQLKVLLAHGGRDRPEGMSLHQAHLHNLARVSELLCNRWYTSDCRFSALSALPDFGRYVADGRGPPLEQGDRGSVSQRRSVLPTDRILFLSCGGLKRLRADCAEHAALRSRLAGEFRRGWLAAFWAAADHAVAHDRGLIEAVNIVRPDLLAPSPLMA